MWKHIKNDYTTAIPKTIIVAFEELEDVSVRVLVTV